METKMPQKGKGYRNLYCPHDSDCADVVAKTKNWNAWNCEICSFKSENRDQYLHHKNREPENINAGEEIVEKICVIPGCKRKDHSRGLCASHWNLWRRGELSHPQFGKWQRIRPVRKPSKIKWIEEKKAEEQKEVREAFDVGKFVRSLSIYPGLVNDLSVAAEMYIRDPEQQIITYTAECLKRDMPKLKKYLTERG